MSSVLMFMALGSATVRGTEKSSVSSNHRTRIPENSDPSCPTGTAKSESLGTQWHESLCEKSLHFPLTPAKEYQAGWCIPLQVHK